jgi:hypothetical protein
MARTAKTETPWFGAKLLTLMEPNQNPFSYAGDFGPEDIVGRKEEIAQVGTVIRDGMRLFLIGRRGLGKTSIMRMAQATLASEGAR